MTPTWKPEASSYVDRATAITPSEVTIDFDAIWTDLSVDNDPEGERLSDRMHFVYAMLIIASAPAGSIELSMADEPQRSYWQEQPWEPLSRAELPDASGHLRSRSVFGCERRGEPVELRSVGAPPHRR